VRIRRVIPLLVLLVGWWGASAIFGQNVVPGPVVTFSELFRMVLTAATWRHVCLTLFRGVAGLAIALAAAFVFGVPCGLSKPLFDVVSPLVSAAQSCPPIVWISLLLVWISIGSAVPIVVVTVTVFPVLFVNIAQGVASLDRGLFQMARVYHVSRGRILREVVLPGIGQFTLAALSFALSVTWKVTATAEFFGSANGMGARIYWAYRVLDMPRLFAWTVLVVAVGVALEMGLIHPLRDRRQRVFK
jgi:NitT/TauT family transport system permease protein